MRFQQVETVVHWAVGKPLTWSLYGCGVALAFVFVAFYQGSKWLMGKRKGVRWAK